MLAKESTRHARPGAMILAAVLAALAFAGPAPAANIFVPGDHPTIQEAIDAAVDGDVVVLYDGTYTGDDNKNLVFNGKAITVRSKDGADGCIIDCEGDGRGFIFINNEPPEATVMEITIINGMSPVSGAGILVNLGSPTITGCVIEGCDSGVYGGGIACFPGTAPTITGNVIEGCQADGYGGAICCINSDGTISGNEISGNEAYYGGGIACDEDAAPLISENTIISNLAYGNGGGIHIVDWACPEISDNSIEDNDSETGGGIFVAFANPSLSGNTVAFNEATDGGGMFLLFTWGQVIDNSITNNTARGVGGGIACHLWCASELTFNTISANSAESGGGINCFGGSAPRLVNNLVNANYADYGGGIDIGGQSEVEIINCTVADNSAGTDTGGLRCSQNSMVTVNSSILWDNSAPSYNELSCDGTSLLTVTYSAVDGGTVGTGNISLDPRFVTGPFGDYYLSALSSGQVWDSACIDAGDPDAEMQKGTTRTDQDQDSGILDMGYHYPISLIVNGGGPALLNPPLVRTFPHGSHEPTGEWSAFGTSHFGVNLACGDVNGDGRDEILAGAGPGAALGPRVRGFEVDGTLLPGLDFSAFDTGTFGVCVAAGDLDGNGLEEIVVGRGPAPIAAPQVRAFSYKPAAGVIPVTGVRFNAFSTLHGFGVNVACGDIDGDGRDEIVTGAGPGAALGSHVRGWNADGRSVRPLARCHFSAYSLSGYGVNVACGDIDGDGRDEIITTPGPGAGHPARVRAWSWSHRHGIKAMDGVDFLAFSAAEAAGGARATCADLDGDGRDELIVSGGADPASGPTVRVYRLVGSRMERVDEYDAFPAGWTHGVSLAAGTF